MRNIDDPDITEQEMLKHYLKAAPQLLANAVSTFVEMANHSGTVDDLKVALEASQAISQHRIANALEKLAFGWEV